MKIIINESQYNFLRRLPAVEDELNKQLQQTDPTEFDTFQEYIEYLVRRTLFRLSVEIIGRELRGEKYDIHTEFRDHIEFGLRNDIRKIYDSGKPGGLF